MAYGAPTNLDLSACNVTATGGSTVQTLADLGKAVGDNATAVAAAQDAASSAQTTAASAAATAATAQTNATAAVSSAATANATAAAAQTTANAAVPTSMAGQPNGYAPLDSNGEVLIGPSTADNRTASIMFNSVGTPSSAQSLLKFFGSGSSQPAQIWSFMDSDSKSCISFNYIQRIRGYSDGFTDLGMASMAWNNIYSKTAVQVTSDVTQKTIIGSLGDTNYADGQKLASALFSLDTAMFQLNASIAAKGAANARLHAGFIAQQVEAAITAAGLDPAKYALWTNSPVYETTEVDTGKKDAQGNAIIENVTSLKKDARGNQVYTQMLRYDQILCVLFEACKAKIAVQDTALEAKSAAPATGSAS